MVRENITQRDTDFHDTCEGIVLAREWLRSKADGVKQFNTAIQQRNNNGKFEPVDDSYRNIAKFLSKNATAHKR